MNIQYIPEKNIKLRYLLSMADKDFQILLQQLSDDSVIARAIRFESDSVINKFLNNVSTRRKGKIEQEMSFIRVCRKKDVIIAQQKIVGRAIELLEKGELFLFIE